MGEEKNWEDEYPEGSAGWKFNRKIDAIEEHPFQSGAVLLSIFVIILLIVLAEALGNHGPFFLWRLSIESYNLALYNTIVYSTILLLLGSSFFYFGVRLLWHGWTKRRK